MRKRLIFSIASTIFLAATIFAVVFAQAQPAQTCETSASDPSTGNIVTTSDGANVILQLPQGVPSHPVNLRIIVTQITGSSDGSGNPNTMQVYIWVPAMNQYVGAAILSTNTNESAINWIKGIVNGTPIWTPPALENYFVPTLDEYQIWMDGDVLMANLTTSFNVTLPDALGGNFTLPPMTLMFRPIALGFAHQETTVLPAPLYSGWTIEMSHTDVPAWVRVEIPMWIANAPVETVGTMMLDGTAIYIPPTP